MTSNVSADLIWEIVRSQNNYLVKSKENPRLQFSRDPLNLTNVHSRKYAGFVNDKAIGINASGKRGVTITSKNAKSGNRPSRSLNTTVIGDAKSNRNAYKVAAGLAAKRGYRGDLREAAVQRVSAIRRSQRPVKADAEKKLRGKAAQKAAEEA